MPPEQRLSYIPEPIISIPPGLKKEDECWQMHPDLVLSAKSAEAMIRSRELMEDLLRSGYLESMNLDSELKGVGSLKGHGSRVAILSLLLNEELERQKSKLAGDTSILATAAMLHDIGKLDKEIHDVVMRPEKFKKDVSAAVAWTIIKRHPTVGRDVAMNMPGLADKERMSVAEAIYCHHERQDGNGYHKTPLSEIPKEAQIISAADAIDVMLGKRPYREPSTTDEVIAELEKCTGQFSREVAGAAKSIRPANGNGEFLHYAV